MPEEIGKRLATFVLKYRFATILACLLSFVGLTFGVTKASFSTDYKIFFAEDDPKRLRPSSAIEHVFSKTDNVVFVVQGPGGRRVHAAGARGDPGAHRRRLEAPARLTRRLSHQLPALVRRGRGHRGRGPGVRARLRAAARGPRGDSFRTRRSPTRCWSGACCRRTDRRPGINVTLRLPGEAPDEVTETTRGGPRHRGGGGRVTIPSWTIRTSGMA